MIRIATPAGSLDVFGSVNTRPGALGAAIARLMQAATSGNRADIAAAMDSLI